MSNTPIVWMYSGGFSIDCFWIF